jgi:hypothetical protein
VPADADRRGCVENKLVGTWDLDAGAEVQGSSLTLILAQAPLYAGVGRLLGEKQAPDAEEDLHFSKCQVG